uniref:LO4 n=1 Tax=Swordtail adomavirus 1 TaxID=2609876 RepID=A0A6F9EZF1_9VIRU|nr:TPA_asm: LO4 [Swordtail adomavirus 1]
MGEPLYGRHRTVNTKGSGNQPIVVNVQPAVPIIQAPPPVSVTNLIENIAVKLETPEPVFHILGLGNSKWPQEDSYLVLSGSRQVQMLPLSTQNSFNAQLVSQTLNDSEVLTKHPTLANAMQGIAESVAIPRDVALKAELRRSLQAYCGREIERKVKEFEDRVRTRRDVEDAESSTDTTAESPDDTAKRYLDHYIPLMVSKNEFSDILVQTMPGLIQRYSLVSTSQLNTLSARCDRLSAAHTEMGLKVQELEQKVAQLQTKKS